MSRLLSTLSKNPLARQIKRWPYYIVACVQILTVLASGGLVRADSTDCASPNDATTCINSDALYSINNNTPFYDPTDTVCSNRTELGTNVEGTAVVVPPGQGTGAWSSPYDSPYKPILEQFMIELLKDIAKKRGASEDDAVTQQHVIGLLAFAKGEGGGVTNNNFWNPFNTGLKADDLVVPGTQASDGSTEVFKSFDAGVEATARVMTGNTQGRLGVTLTDPNTSAADFLDSLLDFPSPEPASGYPTGHSPWAEASNPSAGLDKNGKPIYQPNYRQAHLNLITQVTNDYDSEASFVMRSQSSDPNNKHDTSKLKYHGLAAATAGSSTGASTDGCVTGVGGGGAFFATAMSYSWPTYHQPPYCLMKPEYAVAVKAALVRMAQGKNDYVGGGSSTVSTSAACSSGTAGIDCGGFVTRVFRDSGADPTYNQDTGGVDAQFNYVMRHPTLYKQVTINQYGDLQPGDIYFERTPEYLGHTYIFVGDKGYSNGPVDSASFSTSGASWRTPMASGVYDMKSGIWVRPQYKLPGATTTLAGAATTQTTQGT